MNNHPNADEHIKAELLKIRSFDGKLPAFKKGKMYMDFNDGKIKIDLVYQ